MQDTLLSYQQGMPSLLKLPERQLPALLQPELRHYRLETHACALSFCCRPFLIQPLGILLISVILSLVIKPTSSRYCVQIIGLATALMLHFAIYWKHQARPKPYDGGLASSTLDEAYPWGKVAKDATHAMDHGRFQLDGAIVFPVQAEDVAHDH